jgi:hypothetical protein
LLAGLVVAAVAPLAGPAPALGAGISVTPAFVEVPLDRGRPSGRFELANLGDTPQRYRIRAMAFQFSPSGALIQPKDDPRSLAPWIKFNPAEVSLPPKSSRAIRFVILPRGKLVEGEYWAAMELENLDTRAGSGEDGAGRTIKVEVVSAVMVPIFGTVGKPSYKGELGDITTGADEKGAFIHAEVRNTGTGRMLIRGNYTVTDADGREVATGGLGHSYVLAGSARVFKASVPVAMAAGTYDVSVRYVCAQFEKDLTGEAKLELAEAVAPPAEEEGDAAGAPASDDETEAATEAAAEP